MYNKFLRLKLNYFYRKNPSSNKLITIVAESKNVRIERIISSGQTSPEGFWYDQDKNEFVALLQGETV